jgi:hypothetical protein
VERADYATFATLLNVLSRTFDDQPEFAAFAEPAPDGRGCYRTFCGTAETEKTWMTFNPISPLTG